MPRQLSVSQDEHAPLSFPDPIQRQAMLSPHLYIYVCVRPQEHIYVCGRLIRLTVQFFECALRASNIKDLQSALQRAVQKRGETKTGEREVRDGRANANVLRCFRKISRLLVHAEDYWLKFDTMAGAIEKVPFQWDECY